MKCCDSVVPEHAHEVQSSQLQKEYEGILKTPGPTHCSTTAILVLLHCQLSTAPTITATSTTILLLLLAPTASGRLSAAGCQ